MGNIECEFSSEECTHVMLGLQSVCLYHYCLRMKLRIQAFTVLLQTTVQYLTMTLTLP